MSILTQATTHDNLCLVLMEGKTLSRSYIVQSKVAPGAEGAERSDITDDQTISYKTCSA